MYERISHHFWSCFRSERHQLMIRYPMTVIAAILEENEPTEIYHEDYHIAIDRALVISINQRPVIMNFQKVHHLEDTLFKVLEDLI